MMANLKTGMFGNGDWELRYHHFTFRNDQVGNLKLTQKFLERLAVLIMHTQRLLTAEDDHMNQIFSGMNLNPI